MNAFLHTTLFLLLVMALLPGRRGDESTDPVATGAGVGAGTGTGTGTGAADRQPGFSGVYNPAVVRYNVAEDFSASWLVTRDRYLLSKSALDASKSMAGVSFAVTRTKCKGCFPMMSRDYLDFLVEHLSSTSNSIPHSNRAVFQQYAQRIAETVKALRRVAEGGDRAGVGTGTEAGAKQMDIRQRQTLGVLVYSSITFSRPQAALHCQIRRHFFAATFWSVRRYFPHIVVFVGSDRDRLEVQAMGLPAVEVKQLLVPLDNKNRTVALPRYSLSWVDAQLRNNLPAGYKRGEDAETYSDPEHNITTSQFDWRSVRYVYFTEGDQVLHMRQAAGIFDSLDRGGGRFVMVPHRMQTLPLAQTMQGPDKQALLRVFRQHKYLSHPQAEIVTLDLQAQPGSCCDHGRYTVASCGRWWYQCDDWGLRDLSPWLQFGPTGYTTVAASTHKGACTYSPTRQLCPLPPECQARVPPGGDRMRLGPDVCTEIDLLTHLGPADK
ncbi:hypothetical protein B484DRAFT_434171 [Ochromonadaceae sp. CCMP2298]|nr:hypothetical protein B484DRAFT_434171 [Ochromonadaceae sp. CCMP2298]